MIRHPDNIFKKIHSYDPWLVRIFFQEVRTTFPSLIILWHTYIFFIQCKEARWSPDFLNHFLESPDNLKLKVVSLGFAASLGWTLQSCPHCFPWKFKKSGFHLDLPTGRAHTECEAGVYRQTGKEKRTTFKNLGSMHCTSEDLELDIRYICRLGF